MGKGIRIVKPERSADDIKELRQLKPVTPLKLSPLYYGMMMLTFIASGVALYFFIQSRSA